MKKIKFYLGLAVTMAFLSCSSNKEDYVVPELSIKVAVSTELGKHLVDGEGKTLYFLSKDVAGISTCTDGCLDAWPAFNLNENPISEDLNSDDFSFITRADGTTQTTFKGWPLYYFINDLVIGDTNGDAVGNQFMIAKPDYTVMLGTQDVNGTSITYLVDALGKSLYRDINDTADLSVCNNGCLTVWPIFSTESETIVAPTGIDVDSFGKFIRTGVSEDQITFKGSQLYFFVDDEVRGDVNGLTNPNFVLIPKDFEGTN